VEPVEDGSLAAHASGQFVRSLYRAAKRIKRIVR
jgi:hypothetical protein